MREVKYAIYFLLTAFEIWGVFLTPRKLAAFLLVDEWICLWSQSIPSILALLEGI